MHSFVNGLVKLLATWFGAGLSPVAPGTVGTAAAIPLYLLLARLPLGWYLAFLLIFSVGACWVADRAETIYERHDPGLIVIDEVAGFLLTMAGSACGWREILAGFLLFRFFDVIKPFPARNIDRQLKNGCGVVLDDLVAGLYACLSLQVLVRFWQ